MFNIGYDVAIENGQKRSQFISNGPCFKTEPIMGHLFDSVIKGSNKKVVVP